MHLAVAGSLLIGAIPAVYAGARLSATGANRWVRPVLAVVLLASALKLVNVSTDVTSTLCLVWVVANVGVAAVRRHATRPAGAVATTGVPAEARVETSAREEVAAAF